MTEQADWISLDPSAGKSMNVALDLAFEKLGLPPSFTGATQAGWSRLRTLQLCPHLYRTRHVDGVVAAGAEPAPLATGAAFHAFLALCYDNMIQQPADVVPVDALYKTLLDLPETPLEALADAWRLYEAYDGFYEQDYLNPLAVEYPAEIPGLSCRYDMIAHVSADVLGVPKGTFLVEHKTAGKFDASTLDGWRNDGEILGQVLVYDRLKLAERFGPLEGVIVNLIGKQKVPQFRRLILPVQVWQVEAHARDVEKWRALEALYRAADCWPRSRASCVTRYGLCENFVACCNEEGGLR